MHVFSDLQPYICTFTDCEDELVQFDSRAAWANHEFSKHRNTRSWTCPDCSQEFPGVSGWEQHLQERHCLFFSGTNLQIAMNMALKTEAKSTENEECPLCRIVVGKPRHGFIKHVGRHMEEIALMALPRNVEDNTEEGSSSSEHTLLENAAGISAFRQHHIARGITSKTIPEGDKRQIDAKMQSMGHSMTPRIPPRLSPSRSEDQGQRTFDSKFHESDYIQNALDDRHDLQDNKIDMSDGVNNDQATPSSNDDQSPHGLKYPWQGEALNPKKPEIEHVEWSPAPGVHFARTSYQSSPMRRASQPPDPFAPLFQSISNTRGATTQADSNGDKNVIPYQEILAKIPRANLEISEVGSEFSVGAPPAYTNNWEDSRGFTTPTLVKKRQGRASPPGRCRACNRAVTSEWRRGPDGPRTLCNACGLRMLSELPIS